MLTGSEGYLWGLILLIMIKAEELRVGNRVLVNRFEDDDPWETTVEEIEAMHITASLIPRGGTWVKYEDLNPIPLTPEWLERLGFTTDGAGDDNHNEPLWNHPNTSYQFSDGSLVYNGESYDDWHDIGSVDYVHQLQNLFYWVTGEELQINLP